jgi:hypothetical protein
MDAVCEFDPALALAGGPVVAASVLRAGVSCE